MSPITLDEVLVCPKLPSLPKVALDVLELTRDPGVELSDISEAVQFDPALTAKILKTVNSSYFGLASPCPTISRALGYLGLAAVKSLVLGFGLVDVAKAGATGFDLRAYWRRCTYAAATAQRIARESGRCDPEEAFVAALMQDIGMLALYAAAEDIYPALAGRADGDHLRLPEIEADALGFTHAEVGAELGRRWALPDQIVTPIRFHHRATAGGAGDNDLVSVVTMSCSMAAPFEAEAGPGVVRDAVRFGADAFGMTGEQVEALFRHSLDDAQALASLLSVDTGAYGDVDQILARSAEARLAQAIQANRSVDDLREANVHLQRRAVVDALTGVANRARFDEELASRFEQATAFNACLGLLIVDIDRFKAINDTHGHQVGDKVLAEIAARMRRAVGDAGIVCRYGGEEFAVLVPGADRRRAASIAESIRRAIAAAPVEPDAASGGAGSIPVTASVGVAALETTGCSGVTRESLVTAADRALYAAKDAGRNTVRVFSGGRPSRAAS